ncbi:MAG: hypothetical protein JWL63_950 [Rhodocyclales bacterium]|nr:hypothetical protein [Rhodocyclales bacterium]
MNAAPRTFAASLSAMIGISLVIMLIAIDSTVVGTALPRIVAELKGYDLYPWAASAYLMTNAVMIPIMGRLGDLYGRKRFVIASIILFTFASVLCGLAQSMLQLVLARGLQGVGGGMLTGVAFASVSDLFPDRLQRVRWQAMLSGAFGIATATGPVLGGWLTEHVGWRSVFFVNVPIAVLALPVVMKFLPNIVHHEGEKSIDWLGALLLAVSICGLLLATERGQSHGFGQPLFFGMLGVAIGAGALFIWHQYHSSAPIIPPRLFGNRAVRQLTLLATFTGLTMFVLVFYSPLMLQGGFDLSPNSAGVLITPLLLMITIGSLVNGRVLPRLKHPERLIARGQMLLFIGCLLLVTLNESSPRAWVMFVFGISGLSFGFQLPNLTLQIQSVVERRDIGIASALIQTMRMLGSMIGTSVAGVIVNASFSRHAGELLDKAHISDERVTALLNTPQVLVREQDQASLMQLGQSLNFDVVKLIADARDGLVNGIHNAYIGCAVVVAISIVIALKLPPFALSAQDKTHKPD